MEPKVTRVETWNFRQETHLQQIHDNASRVNVADYHDVEVPEQTEFSQVDGGLSVRLRCLGQMSNRPHDREQDGPAANQINEDQEFVPQRVADFALLALFKYDHRHVWQDLRQDHEMDGLRFNKISRKSYRQSLYLWASWKLWISILEGIATIETRPTEKWRE